MRKLLVPALILVLVVIFIVACGEANMNEEAESIVPESIIQICEDHNEGLEYIYDGLQNTDNLTNPDEQIYTLAQEYFDMKYPNQSMTTKHYFKSGVSDLSNYYEHIMLAKNAGDSTETSYYLHLINELSDSLSQKQIELLVEIHATSNIDNLDEAIEELEEIISVKSLLIPEEDRYIVLLAAEMCKYSFTYWHDHLEEWYELLSSEETLAKRTAWFDWGDVGTSDSGAAIGTLAGVGVIAIVTGPVGWAATLAAVASAGVGTSVAQAYDQIMSQLLK